MTLKQTYQQAQQKTVKDFFYVNEKLKKNTGDNFFIELMKKKTVAA